MKHWTFRQLAIAILLIAASTITLMDASVRDRSWWLFGSDEPTGQKLEFNQCGDSIY